MPALLFDWDGTVLNSKTALIEAYRRSTQEIIGHVFPMTDEEFGEAYTRSGAEVFRRLAESDDEVQELAEAYQRHYFSIPTAPYEGILYLLDRLASAGVLLGVVTSKSRSRLEHDLKMVPELDIFDVMVCADDVVRVKPDPEPVLLALHRLGEKSLFAMVGDTVVDVEASQAAGLQAIGAGWGFGNENDLRRLGATIASTPEEVISLLPGNSELWDVR